MIGSARRQFAGVLAANVGIAGLNFITGTLSARLLQPAGRGELAAIQVVPGLLGWALLLGVPNGIAFFVARLPRKRRQVFATGLALCGVLSAAGALLGVPLVLTVIGPDRPELRAASLAYLPFIFLQGVQLPGFVGLWAMQRFRVWNLLRLAPASLWLATLGLLWLTGSVSAPRAAITYLLLYAALTPVVLLAFVRSSEGRLQVRRGIGRRMVRYGLPTALGNVPTVLNQRLDQALMAALLPATALGLYAVSVAWSAVLSPVSSAIASVLFPRLAASRGSAAAQDFGRGIRLAVLASSASVVVLAAATPFTIPLVFGSSYRGATPAALLLVVAEGFASLNAVLEESLRGLGHPRWPLYGQLGGLPVTVVLLLLLLRPFGLVGAAVASLAAYATTTILLLLGATRVTGLGAACFLPSTEDVRSVLGSVRPGDP